MDFIDEFIQEYQNNQCLWKADSVNFKNRTKRQEAYIKLIAVAAKHGEHYNIERTKQKINNLRCAFRHQLKKYIEFKNKGEKDEPYCPKRRYFESLMFLKDEESLDRKSKRETSCILKNSYDTEPESLLPASSLNLNDSTSYVQDQVQNVTTLTDNSAEACTNILNEVTKDNFSHSNVKIIHITKETNSAASIDYDDRKQLQRHESLELSPVGEMNQKESQIYEFDDESPIRSKKRSIYRKRSSSLSSQISKETESVTKKSKVDFNTMDFEKVFSLACKSIHNNMDDHFTSFGKIIAHKLRSMDSTQAIYAEKIIADVLFHGQMKLLTALSINQFVSADCTNSFGEINTNK